VAENDPAPTAASSSTPDLAPRTARATRAGVRLDRVLADALGCSRRVARTLIRAGRVRVNARPVSTSRPLALGDEVQVLQAQDSPGLETDSVDARLRVLWRGNDFWVLSKPAAVHSHRGRSAASVAASLIARDASFASAGMSADEGGLVHRLDRDTSGVLLAARNADTYRKLRAQFAARAVIKQYLGLVDGRVTAHLSIDCALARRATRVVPARVRDRALEARSDVRVLEARPSWSLVEVEIRTGVTHQVRAHLALAGHPLIGDTKYGGRAAPQGTRAGQLLHARSISLPEDSSFAAPVPADFLLALALLRREP